MQSDNLNSMRGSKDALSELLLVVHYSIPYFSSVRANRIGLVHTRYCT